MDEFAGSSFDATDPVVLADLAGLVEAAPDGLLLVDGDGTILLANQQVEELFGYTRAELIGQAIERLLPTAAREAHVAHRNRYRSDPRTRSMGSGLDLYGQRRDGSTVVVEVGLSPTLHDGRPAVIAAIRDISARVAADAHTRRIERLIDRAHEGVYLLDPQDLRFTYVNAGAAVQSGYGRQALLSMTPLHLMPDMDEAILRRLIERAAAAGRISPVITRLRRSDGVDLPVELLLEWDTAPEGTAVAVLVRDLSERRESEEELEETRRELALVEDRERIARDLHDRVIQRLFATGMSLQAIVAHLLDDTLSGRIGRAVDDLDTTIREIRAVIFELQPPDQGESVRRRVLSTARDARASLGFEPVVRFDGPIDTVIDGAVAAELLATLQEGLSNVARHARATAVTVTVTVSSRAGDDVVLEIVDDGVGIAAPVAGGNGLINMATRAERLGGSCEVAPVGARGGTRLRWSVPAGRS